MCRVTTLSSTNLHANSPQLCEVDEAVAEFCWMTVIEEDKVLQVHPCKTTEAEHGEEDHHHLPQLLLLEKAASDVLTEEGDARFLAAHSGQDSPVVTRVVCRIHHFLQPHELGVCLFTDILMEGEMRKEGMGIEEREGGGGGGSGEGRRGEEAEGRGEGRDIQ